MVSVARPLEHITEVASKPSAKKDRVGLYGLLRTAKGSAVGERFKRLQFCHEHVRTNEVGAGEFGGHFVPETGGAYFTGLATCGSAWICPVCAEAIWNYRKHELAEALKIHRGRGGKVLFITLTASHHHIPLEDLLDKLSRAVRLVYTGGTFNRWKQRAGYLGSIKATEITWSAVNGWHPHFHVLWLLDELTPAQLAEASSYVDSAWRKALTTVGLSGSVAHACTVKDSSWDIEEYMAKMGHERAWDSDAELTMGTRKHGKRRGLSAWDLLRVAAGELQAPGCDADRARALFYSYACATQGRHSFRWSPGLREALGLGPSKTDDDIAAEDDIEHDADVDELRPASVQLLGGTPAAWRVIVANDARGELIDRLVAGPGGMARLQTFCEALGLRCSRRDGYVWTEAP